MEPQWNRSQNAVKPHWIRTRTALDPHWNLIKKMHMS